MILEDLSGPRSQAGVVPIRGEFMAGVVRAAVNPIDGQLWTVGLDGWGDYSTNDGCLHRIRYTSNTLKKPIAYKKVPSIRPNGTVTVTGFPRPSPKFKDVSLFIVVDWRKDRMGNLNNESNERNNYKYVHCVY